MNVLPDVYICSLRKNFAPLLPKGTVGQYNYTSGSIANSQRMLTEINKSGFITKIRI